MKVVTYLITYKPIFYLKFFEYRKSIFSSSQIQIRLEFWVKSKKALFILGWACFSFFPESAHAPLPSPQYRIPRACAPVAPPTPDPPRFLHSSAPSRSLLPLPFPSLVQPATAECPSLFSFLTWAPTASEHLAALPSVHEPSIQCNTPCYGKP
jgi:hypothetical protein